MNEKEIIEVHYPTTGKEVFNEGDKVWAPGIDGDKKYGTLHKNTEHPHVSEWYIKYDDGEECAALDMFYVNHATGKEVTAMAELIAWMDKNKSHCTYGTIRGKATELLPKVKQQITEAFTSGQANIADIFFDEDANIYFTTTYKKI